MPDLDNLRQKAWSAALIVLFFVAWELFCLMTGMSDLILPRPSQIFTTLFEKFPILWPHILQTLATTMLGFVLGVALGVVLGAIIGSYSIGMSVGIGAGAGIGAALGLAAHEEQRSRRQ